MYKTTIKPLRQIRTASEQVASARVTASETSRTQKRRKSNIKMQKVLATCLKTALHAGEP